MRRTVSPVPPRLGRVDGLAYALFEPPGGAEAGVVVIHGADSRKENHFDIARLLCAEGLAAVCFDQRGHGASDGPLGASAVEDVATMASLLPAGGPIGLRGSSMGGWLALAAAERVGAAGVVAICPATSDGLRRGLRDRRFAFAVDEHGLTELLDAVDLPAAAAALGSRLLLLHAEGDETVPVEHSRALHAAAPGSRLVAVPGGHHRSVQHDPELQALSARFLRRALLG